MENRINSVDISRGLATVYMIIYHSYAILTAMNYGLFGDLIIYFAQVFSTVFLIVSGSSFFFFLNKNKNSDMPRTKIFNITLKRAFFIIVVVTVIQVIYGLIFPGITPNLIHWSVFHVVGISMILFLFLPFLKRNLRIIAYISSFSLVFLLAHIIITYNIIFLLFLVGGGEFPILPWVNFYIFGIIVGDFIINASESGLRRGFYISISLGIFLVIIWIWGANGIIYLFIHQFVWGIGAFLIAFPILYYYTDMKMYCNGLLRRLIVWGKFTFSIYYIHMVILFFIKKVLKSVLHLTILNNFTIYYYIIFVPIFTIILDLFLRIWKRFDYKFGFEWAMRKFADISFTLKKDVGEFD